LLLAAAAAAAIAWLGYKLSVTAARERNLFETNGAYIADEKNARARVHKWRRQERGSQ
jgi:hypothetical protein